LLIAFQLQLDRCKSVVGANPRICEEVESEKFNSFGARWNVWDFTKGSTDKRICRPRFYIYSLNICTVHTTFIGFCVLAFV